MAQKNRANMLTDIVSNIFNNLINFITGQNAQDRFVNLLDSSPNILSDKNLDAYLSSKRKEISGRINTLKSELDAIFVQFSNKLNEYKEEFNK